MRFIDTESRRARVARLGHALAAAGLASGLVACTQTPPAPTPAPAPAPAAARPPAPAPSPAPSIARGLPPAAASRNWAEFKMQAARRMVAATPDGSYMGPVPEPLLAIPVLEVELNGDGSVRNIVVMRHPTQARDTTQLAIEAVRRAAPFGDVSRLPKPWKFSEVFVFNDDRRFKPRTLDID